MKTIKTILVAIFAMVSGALFASGGGNLNVNMETTESEFTLVEISSANMSNYEVKVRDAFGEHVYSNKTVIPGSSVKKKYDFSKLEDGIYWFSVKVDKQTTTNKFEVSNGGVEVLESRKSIDPYFAFENDMLKFTCMNPELEKVKLLVYDMSGNVLVEKNLGNDLAIHKALDFSKRTKGNYDVVLVNDIEIFEHTVTIE